MIKAGGTDAQGRPLVVVGLTAENLLRLADGEPMLFDAAEVGFAGSVLILGGISVEDIIQTMRRWNMTKPTTRIRHEPGPTHPTPPTRSTPG